MLKTKKSAYSIGVIGHMSTNCWPYSMNAIFVMVHCCVCTMMNVCSFAKKRVSDYILFSAFRSQLWLLKRFSFTTIHL